MPYKGEQAIEFPQHETQNVMLLFGDNMRGKTSFLNAIRWGFYGIALGRHLRKIPRVNLVNSDAADEGDWTMAIELYFEHDNNNYELKRRIIKRDNVSKPHNHADFEEHIGLRINGEPTNGDLVDTEINQIMPSEISRFFLFDGELLQEYENLLIEQSEQGEKIKKRIEAILGVPALINGKEDLQSLLNDARKQQRKDAQKIDAGKGYSQEQENLQIELQNFDTDLDSLKNLYDTIQDDIDKIDDVLKNTEAVQAKKIEISALEEAKKNNETQIGESQDSIQTLLATAWKDVLSNNVQPIIKNLKNERERLQDAWHESARLQNKIESLRASLEKNTNCETCGQEIPESLKQPLREKILKTEAKKSEIVFDTNALKELENRIDNLDLIRSEGECNRIINELNKITKHKVALISVDNQLDELNEEIEGFDTDEIMRQREKMQRLGGQSEKVKLDIEGVESKILLNRKKQEKLSQLMKGIPGAHDLISTKRVECLEKLETVFGEGIIHLRDKLKESVQNYATQAFMKLTTEESYSGLQINKSYGLSILDHQGRELKERSAGAEQIVALALIDGLNKTSNKKAPIIMDTPLGRLDPIHRKNVLQYLPDMSEQVVLLVHEGEIHSKRDTKEFAHRIGARYEIKRVSATQSRIEKVME